jgi:hypothetical protein
MSIEIGLLKISTRTRRWQPPASAQRLFAAGRFPGLTQAKDLREKRPERTALLTALANDDQTDHQNIR